MKRHFHQLTAALMLLSGAALAQQAVPSLPPEVMRMRECADQKRAIIERAIKAIRLPVTISVWMPQAESELAAPCELRGAVYLYGSGTVGAEMVESALAGAGLKAKVGLNTVPLPLDGPISSGIWPVRPEVLAIGPQHRGGKLTVQIRLQNLTFFRLSADWDSGAVRYVLFDEEGKIVRWDEDRLVSGGGSSLDCPPLGYSGDLTRTVPLDHFNADLPLEPGLYTLRLSLNRLWIGGREVSTTLPDLPFEILP